MNAIQKIFQLYGPQYLARYGDKMPAIHKKAMRDIADCRDGSFGTLVYQCPDCRTPHVVACCCGNRHCPGCQQDKMDQWLHKQTAKLLPAHYFLLTMTLPQGLRQTARSHQRIVYAAMFACAQAAIKKLARDKRFIGSAKIGCLAALHTWGGMLLYSGDVFRGQCIYYS